MAAPNLKVNFKNLDPFAKFKVKSSNGYAGGKYAYKKWGLDSEGNRIAIPCYREDEPDLQSTYIYNPDGSEVLRYIRLDLDAIKTLLQWKDKNGSIDWLKIAAELHKNFPGIIRQIEFVTRSHSGKGLHILIGIAPLPLSDKTMKTQIFIRKIQSDLIRIFNELGIGADPAGKGLKQDFATYRNPKNVLHHNRLLTKRIENSAKKRPYIDDNGNEVVTYQNVNFLNHLNKEIEKGLEYLEIKNGYRLYQDMRLEPKIAKLFLFILGMYRPVLNSTSFERENAADSDFNTFYAAPNNVSLTLDQIAEIMETEKRNIYKSFWEKEEIQRLFHAERNIDGTYQLAVVDAKNMAKRIQRALAIWNHQPFDFDFGLIPPELVGDGFRNTSIVSWVLSLKWHGVSEEVALQMLLELVKKIPSYETSSSCKKKQLRSTLQSIYRNRRETTGIKFSHALPEWLLPENVLLPKRVAESNENGSTTISLSRSIPFSSRTTELMQEESLGIDPSSLLQGLPEGSNFLTNKIDLDQFLQGASNAISNEDKELNEKKESKQTQRLRVVTYNHRIGFYLNGELLLCLVNNRHYKLTNAVRYIEKEILKNLIKFDILKDVIHVRHNSKAYKEMALNLYNDAILAIQAQHICGHKNRYYENMYEYGAKKAKQEGISFDEYKERLDNKYSTSTVGSESFYSDSELWNDIPF